MTTGLDLVAGLVVDIKDDIKVIYARAKEEGDEGIIQTCNEGYERTKMLENYVIEKVKKNELNSERAAKILDETSKIISIFILKNILFNRCVLLNRKIIQLKEMFENEKELRIKYQQKYKQKCQEIAILIKKLNQIGE